jgi:hypothetical protein
MGTETRHLCDEVIAYVDTFAEAHDAESELSAEAEDMLRCL